MSANGGTPELLIEDEVLSVRQKLPDGKTVLLGVGVDADERGVAVQSLATGERKVLFQGSNAAYVPTGHIVFERGGALFGVGFDVDNLAVIGGPVALVDSVSSAGVPQFALSDTGTLVVVSGQDVENRERILGLATRGGDVDVLDVPRAEYASPRLSPDGNRLAVQSSDTNGAGTVWVYELSGRRAMRQLTLEGNSRRPVWTPDGQRITFASDRDGTMSLYWQRADGSGVAGRLTTVEEGVAHFPSSWSPDGKILVYMVHTGGNLQANWDVWTLSVDDGAVESLYDLPDGVYLAPELSPDGRWLAYSAGDFAGQQDVYIEPFPPTGARHRISQSGAYWPTWSPVGDELFYRPNSLSQTLVLNSVDITTEPEFAFSNERTLPIEGFVVVGFYRDYDVTSDGEKLLMVFPAETSEGASRPRPRINIVLNWFEELKDRVPY